MRRQRHTFKPDMVAHLWANQSLDHARVAHGNFWFTGPALYSYGDHYVVGFHMPKAYDRDGAAVALLNSRSYSTTTNKHQHAARRALPGSVARCDVDGLNNDDIRAIDRNGAHTITAKLIAELRALADKAANPRIRPDTRAALLHRIHTVRDWAFHFARCDAARRYLTKDQRARARAQLAELKHEPFASGDDKAGAAGYARAVNRAEYVAKLRTVETEAQLRGDALLALHGSGEPADAHARLQAFDRVHTQAREYTERAGVKLPRALAALARKVGAVRADIIAAHRAAEIADARALWTAWEPQARDILTTCFPGNVYALLSDLREAAHVLADEAGADERAAFLAECTQAMTQWQQQDECTKAQRMLDGSRRLASAGRYSDAEEAIQAALTFYRRGGIEAAGLAAIEEEADQLHTAAIAQRRDEYRQRLTDWRNAMPGASFPDALHRQFSTEPGALLRLSADHRRIETSRGAEVPARIAGALWQAIEDRRARVWEDITRTPYAGMQLGHFRLDAIEPDGAIRAGCHFIPYAELLDIAQRLGLTNPAQDAA